MPWRLALEPLPGEGREEGAADLVALTKGWPTGVNSPFKRGVGIVPRHPGAGALRVEGDGHRRLGAPPILLAEIGQRAPSAGRDFSASVASGSSPGSTTGSVKLQAGHGESEGESGKETHRFAPSPDRPIAVAPPVRHPPSTRPHARKPPPWMKRTIR